MPASTPTSSLSSSSTPTPVSGNDIYVLRGCFSEPEADSGTRALGANGNYTAPIFGSADALTVPLCLEACAVALASSNQGVYNFAGVENGRYVKPHNPPTEYFG